MSIKGHKVPQIQLPNNVGNFKVLIGEYNLLKSKIPTFSKLFLYHLELNPEQEYSLIVDENDETALVVINGKVLINKEELNEPEMVVLDKKGTLITISNPTKSTINILVFGGEPYNETIAFGGPYVMNSQEEITQANHDYYNGAYGEIEYK